MDEQEFERLLFTKRGPSAEEIERARAAWYPCASAKYNGDFFIFFVYSGFNSAIGDPDATDEILPAGADDIKLGQAIQNALQQSRFLSYEEEGELILNSDKNYKKWVEDLQTRCGYKTKQALFKKMMSCSIDLENGVLTIRPSHHERLEAWSGEGFTEADAIEIPADSPPEKIGAALRVAMSRCTGKGAAAL